MTFSYSQSFASDVDRVRFYLNDRVHGSGPRPAAGNYSNEELTALIAQEGSWQRAVAAGFEALTSEWTTHPSFSADGLDVSRSHIALGYQRRAESWRKNYGYAPSAGTSAPKVTPLIRVDGYSDDVDSLEVT